MKASLRAGCAAVVLVVTGTAARAADQDAINRAIDRGVAYLHDKDREGVPESMQPAGAAALVGLTLLECGARPDDEAVRHALDATRQAALSSHETYTLALAVLFLDRLGDPADEPLIESMAVRLMAGQQAGGGWSYTCPEIPESEVRRLGALAEKHASPGEAAADERPRRTPRELPKEIRAQLANVEAIVASQPATGVGDNSNTQFASLALWVARRHGIPAEKALARIYQRFRLTQNADGGWSYTPSGSGTPAAMTSSTAAMTCSGLLGLAVGHGSAAEAAVAEGKNAPDLSTNRFVKAGLAALGTAVGVPAAPGGPVPSAGGKSFYFFWSLERVCVILDLKTVGGKDWYAWGSEILVANQGPGGSWAGEYPPAVDTCFALLFLKRANLARDLTASLKGTVKDGGEVTLKSGGVGGVGLKSGLEAKDRPAVLARPPAEETEGGRMARELAQAPAGRRDELLTQYREGKGVTFTEALAGAIPRLDGDDRGKARDALADRLTRMKADTLSRYFQDQDAEIRRAAALAAAMKGAKTLVPDLFPLLGDPEPAVAHAAHAALKDLTGEKLGPAEDEWKAWWKDRDR